MNEREAIETLEDSEVVSLARGSIPYIKELMHKCLDADIPAIAGCPPGEGKG